MEANAITGIIVDSSIKIHFSIGPGCFEKVYEELLYYELNKISLNVKRQITMPISYEVLQINDAYKLDLLIEDKVIIESLIILEMNKISLYLFLLF